jgi:large subunit ribosomal protein L24
MAEKIITGDEVIVIHGRNKGARGTVRQNKPKEDRLVVEGVNIVRKHMKRGRARQAGIVEVEAPLHASKVMLVCPNCGDATRVGFRLDDKGVKERFCKKCDATVPRRVPQR